MPLLSLLEETVGTDTLVVHVWHHAHAVLELLDRSSTGLSLGSQGSC